MKIYTVLQLDNGNLVKIGDIVKVKGINIPHTKATIHGLNGNEFIKDYDGQITFYTEKYNMFSLSINDIEEIELVNN